MRSIEILTEVNRSIWDWLNLKKSPRYDQSIIVYDGNSNGMAIVVNKQFEEARHDDQDALIYSVTSLQPAHKVRIRNPFTEGNIEFKYLDVPDHPLIVSMTFLDGEVTVHPFPDNKRNRVMYSGPKEVIVFELFDHESATFEDGKGTTMDILVYSGGLRLTE